MNPPVPPRSRATVLLVALILLGILLCALGIGGAMIVRSLRMPVRTMPDFGAEVVNTLDLEIRSDVEVNAPPWLVALARLISHCVDIEPEASGAVRAVRDARVHVYELRERPDRDTRSKLTGLLQKRFADLGWQRVVCVMDSHDLVLVYLPDSAPNTKHLELAVLVLSDRELVAVSASGNLDSLSDLVSLTMDRHRGEILSAFH